ncbi:PRADC1-like protein [Atheta coriaria]|uniref:PRADC1-like protein n=1 Tax=Dalotia coriaria TaxID=877792 RepID=UPI0031F433AE
MRQEDFFAILVIIAINLSYTYSGPNNLHLSDGTSTAELISGDVFFEIVEPEVLEYTYRLKPAKDFGIPFNKSIEFKHILLVPAQPRHACTDLTNIDDIEGNVAFIERGDCSFKKKTIIAEKAGARAVIITDTNKENEEYYVEMIDDDLTTDVNIPAGFLIGRNGIMIMNQLRRLNMKYAVINLPVNLTFTPVHKINQPPWLDW